MPESSRILFVDKDEDCRLMMSILLRMIDENFDVTAVRTAAEALQQIENQPFDLLILDYWLPDASGVDLCDRIRAFDGRTPIVFYTGMARESDRRSAVGAGADAYLVRPNDLDKISETILRCLGRKDGGVALAE